MRFEHIFWIIMMFTSWIYKVQLATSKHNTKYHGNHCFYCFKWIAISNTVMLLSKREKEKLVIKLANEGKTIRDIAKEVHISEIHWTDSEQGHW